MAAILQDLPLYNSLRQALMKVGTTRSYDDILTLKQYLGKLDFMKSKMSGLHPKQIDDLCVNLVLEEFHYHEIVFNQGDVGDKLYFVLEGEVSCKVKMKIDLGHGVVEQREKVLFTFGAGAHFGERALEQDEPRGATIQCVSSAASCISVTKQTYLSIVNNSGLNLDAVAVKPHSKQQVIKVLSKARERRSAQEIEDVATYFKQRIPFFSKFDFEQQKELARVSEVVSIWGQQVLFKQGQVGQAFYIILTGSVEVWVASPESDKRDREGADANKGLITEGLGNKVTTVPMGGSFGERALESDTSLRMGSIITSDNLTELIVVSKEDYQNLIYIMKSQDNNMMIALLRRTHVFRDLDITYLKALAKFMVPRTYHLNEVLYACGERAAEIIIIQSGEARVELAIREFTNPNPNQTGSTEKSVALGRVGPTSVLGAFVSQCSDLYQSVHHVETVTASTLMTCFIVTKGDFFLNLEVKHRSKLVHTIKHYKRPKLPFLWDSEPKVLTERMYKAEVAWSRFKEGVVEKKGHNSATVMECLDTLRNVNLSADSTNANLTYGSAQFFRTQRTDASVATSSVDAASVSSSRYTAERSYEAEIDRQPDFPDSQFLAKYTRNIAGRDRSMAQKAQQRAAAAQEAPEDTTDRVATQSRSMPTLPSYKKAAMKSVEILKNNLDKGLEDLVELAGDEYAAAGALPPVQGSLLPGVNSGAFALVQLHREPVRMRGGVGSRRLVRCHMRLCGVFSDSHGAKNSAEELMAHAFTKLYKCDINREDEVKVKWSSFHGFDSIPLQSSDHFIIYCRSAPLEWASFTMSKDMLTHTYPPKCKPRRQAFCCLSIRRISEQYASNEAARRDAGAARRAADKEQRNTTASSSSLLPIFMIEVSALSEVLAASSTYLESLRFAMALKRGQVSLANSMASSTVGADRDFSIDSSTFDDDASSRLRICIVPLYEWFVLTDETLKVFDFNNNMQEVLNEDLSRLGTSGSAGNTALDNALLAEMRKAFTNAKILNAYNDRSTQLKELRQSNVKAMGISGEIKAVDSSPQITPTMSIKTIEREVARRQLAQDIATSTGLIGTKELRRPAASAPAVTSTASDSAAAGKIASTDVEPEDTIDALKGVIANRRKMFAMNDQLCSRETGAGTRKKTMIVSNQVVEVDESDEEDEETKWSRRKKRDYNLAPEGSARESAGMGLLLDRMSLLDAINSTASESSIQGAMREKFRARSERKAPGAEASAASSQAAAALYRNILAPVPDPSRVTLQSKLGTLEDMLARERETTVGVGYFKKYDEIDFDSYY